jgi:formylglycine-generating enzyme required for sulfatase activity
MATNQASMARRQRERQRQQKRRDKIAKKMERRQEKAANGAPSADDSIDWSSAVKESKELPVEAQRQVAARAGSTER